MEIISKRCVDCVEIGGSWRKFIKFIKFAGILRGKEHNCGLGWRGWTEWTGWRGWRGLDGGWTGVEGRKGTAGPGIAECVPGLHVCGITERQRLHERTPTFAVSLEGYRAREVAERLGEQGIFVWDGHYYAVAPMERLGVLDSGGLVRIGFVHYNTEEEADRVLAALQELARA